MNYPGVHKSQGEAADNPNLSTTLPEFVGQHVHLSTWERFLLKAVSRISCQHSGQPTLNYGYEAVALE